MAKIEALLFDKDGTLFDFQATWGAWAAGFIRELADSAAQVAELAEAMRYDLAARRFFPDSPFVAETVEGWVAAVLPVLPGSDPDELRRRITVSTAVAPQIPVTPLEPLLGSLRGDGYRLGVATNDGIGPVSRQLADAALDHHFEFVAGFDSGHGAKPGPGMLLAFAEALAMAPETVLMIGDSRHDLDAAAAAGMPAVAVLTGTASEGDLAPFAEVVLPTIAELPAWLEARKPTGPMSQTAMTGTARPA